MSLPEQQSRPPSHGRLDGWAAWMAAAHGRRRALLAIACGLLAAGALPPLFLVPLLIPAFTGLLWLLDGVRRPRQALLLGWCFGLGFFAAGLYWVGIAMTVDLARFGWFMPVSVLGLSSGLAIFIALAVWGVWASGIGGTGRVLLLAAAWLAAELARSIVLSGFPWNLLGTVWSFHALPLQGAALFGVWGLGALTLLAAAAPAVLAGQAAAGRRGGGLFLAGCWLLLLAAGAGGLWRLAAAPDLAEANQPEVLLRLVQPSIPQEEKWQGDLREQHLRHHAALSLEAGAAAATHIIWPETAIPWYLNREPALIEALADLVPPGGLLLTGAPAADLAEDGTPRIYNSIFALDEAGETRLRFDKYHLVPFGEFLPARGLLAAIGMNKLTAGSLDFSRGPGPITADLAGLPPLSLLVCYEVIFSGLVTATDGPRPAWLLNLTNDAWFGLSSGPHQHFASARMRAVEEGLPLVRVANNGISAVVDPYGRVTARLGLDAVGVIDAPLPLPLEATPYARFGRLWAVALLGLLLASGLLAGRRRRGSSAPRA